MPERPKLNLPRFDSQRPTTKPSLRWNSKHIGMVHYSSYWGRYSLVLDVYGLRATELDGFAGVNQHPTNARVRTHFTPPDKDDKFLTVEEFYSQVINRSG